MLPDANNCMRRAIGNQYSKMLYEFGFKIRPIITTGAYAIVGTGSHSAARHLLIQKMHGKTISLSHAIDFGISEYEIEGKKYEKIEYDKVVYNKEAGILHIKKFTQAYYTDIVPKMSFPDKAKPNDHLELTLKKTFMGFNLSGHVDVWTGNSICDTKTGAKKMAYHSQLGGYGLLIGESMFKKLYINWLPRVSLSKPYPGTKIIAYDKKFAMTEAYTTIVRIIDAINKFKSTPKPSCFPANPNSYLCSEKYCRAYGTNFCEYYKI